MCYTRRYTISANLINIHGEECKINIDVSESWNRKTSTFYPPRVFVKINNENSNTTELNRLFGKTWREIKELCSSQ